MKSKKYTIPIYDVDLYLVQFDKKDEKEDVEKLLKQKPYNAVNEDYKEEILFNVGKGMFDGANTIRNMDILQIIVQFYPFSSPIKQEEIYAHEKRHIEDRMLQHFNIDDIESAALLAGYLATLFYDFKKETNGRSDRNKEIKEK